MRKNFLKAIIICVIGVTLVGCGSNSTANKKDNNTANNTKTEQKQDKKEEIPIHKIGEKVELPDATVSVTNVRKLDTKTTVYAVEMEITNTGKEDLKSDFMNNYILKDNEDRKGEAINNQDLKGELLFDTIAPGEKLKGEIAYELQDNSTPKTIKICYNGNDYTVFNLENK